MWTPPSLSLSHAWAQRVFSGSFSLHLWQLLCHGTRWLKCSHHAFLLPACFTGVLAVPLTKAVERCHTFPLLRALVVSSIVKQAEWIFTRGTCWQCRSWNDHAFWFQSRSPLLLAALMLFFYSERQAPRTENCFMPAFGIVTYGGTLPCDFFFLIYRRCLESS